MSTTAIVVIVVVVVVALFVIGVGITMARRTGRRRQLRDRFGPEYERTVQASGILEEAEADLQARAEERDKLSIRPLDSAERDRYELDWRQIQTEFVDAPALALGRADALITDVMVDRAIRCRSSISRLTLFRLITQRLSNITAGLMGSSSKVKLVRRRRKSFDKDSFPTERFSATCWNRGLRSRRERSRRRVPATDAVNVRGGDSESVRRL